MIEMVGPEDLGTGWRGAFGTFMISRPILSCSHWLEFAYTECSHWWNLFTRNTAMTSFLIQHRVESGRRGQKIAP